MKAIGIVRKTDGLGRIVLPKELRDTMGLEEGTPMEIFVDGNQVILRKYEMQCEFCGEKDDQKLIKLNGKSICRACAIRLGVMAEEGKHETA